MHWQACVRGDVPSRNTDPGTAPCPQGYPGPARLEAWNQDSLHIEGTDKQRQALYAANRQEPDGAGIRGRLRTGGKERCK